MYRTYSKISVDCWEKDQYNSRKLWRIKTKKELGVENYDLIYVILKVLEL